MSEPQPVTVPRLTWVRRLAVLLACLAPALGAWHLVGDGDVFWHLSAGRHVLETGHVAKSEWLSATRQGAPWTDVEWLVEPSMAWIEARHGAPGLQVWTMLFAGGAVLLVLVSACRHDLVAEAVLALTVSLPLFLERIRPRPEMGAFLLAPLAFLCGGMARRRPAWICGVAVAWCWTQTHPSWVLFPLFWFWGAWRAERVDRVAWLGGLSVVAGFLSPAGPALMTFPFAHGLMLRKLPVEIAEWGHLSARWVPFALAAALLLLLGLWRRSDAQRSFGRLPFLAAVLAGVALVTMAFWWGRSAPFLFLAAGLCAPRLPARWKDAGAFAALVAGLIPLPFFFPAPDHRGVSRQVLQAGYDPERVPVRLVQLLADLRTDEPVFHAYRFGGLVGYQAPGERMVFFDGRYFPFLEELREFDAARNAGGAAAAAFTERHGFAFALLDYPGVVRRDTGQALYDPLFPAPDWCVLDFDDAAVLRIRRDHLGIAGCPPPYDWLDPEHPERLVEAWAGGKRQEVDAEFARHGASVSHSARRDALYAEWMQIQAGGG